MAAIWSPPVRSRLSDIAMSRPSAETTRVCCTPGTLFTKLSSSQLKFAASVLIVAFTVVFLRWIGLFVTSVGWGSGLSAGLLRSVD